MTFRYFARLSASIALMVSVAAQADGVVNIFNWSDYIDESVLDDFTAETGIDVVYDVYDSNEILESLLLSGKTGYDLVVPSGDFLQRQISVGIFQPLQKDKLPNLSNMWDVIGERTALYDPGNNYSINYMWGTTGIGYNVDAAEERIGGPITSWDVIFDPAIAQKFEDCGIYVLDAPNELIPTALLYLGYDPNSHDEGEIAEATDLLVAMRPFVEKFHSSQYISALASGDICLAVGWSGDVFLARDEAVEGVNIDYSVPSEGVQLWFDQMAIPADAENVEEAHIFLNYIMRPDVIAKASNYVYYANGNLASQALLEDDVIGDPAIYPDADTMARTYITKPYPQDIQRMINRAWDTIKTGQ